MSKVKMKVSGCFRTFKYAQAYCRISSYLQSMAAVGYNPQTAITIALAGGAADMVGDTEYQSLTKMIKGGVSSYYLLYEIFINR